MKAGTLARILPTVVGIGFCVIAAVKVWAMFGATNAPDPASGHTEATLFAPVISTDWSYITHGQILILIGVTGVVLLLAGLMLGVQFYERFFGTDDDGADAGHDPVAPSSPVIKTKAGTFGHRVPRL